MTRACSALILVQLQVDLDTSLVAKSQARVSDIVHEILMLLVDKSPYIPVELRQIRRVLPALYEGLWACDIERLDFRSGGVTSAADILAVLNRCEVSLWILYDTIQGSRKDLQETPFPSEATGLDELECLSAANSLIKQIHVALSSLAQRKPSRSPGSTQTEKAERRSRASGASSQAWKYVCTGTGGQHNTVQEGEGYQVITNSHKIHCKARQPGL